jgi:hypothetical protein
MKMDFYEFLRNSGIEDPEKLMNFINAFIEQPAIVSKYSRAQIKKFENELDAALSNVTISISS